VRELGVGVAAGVVASVVFLLVLSALRPRLKISTAIAKTATDDGNPEFRYRFKVVNRSRRSCVDVKMSAYLVRSRLVPDGRNGHAITRVMRRVDLRRSGEVIPGYRRKDINCSFAQRVRVADETITAWHTSDQQVYLLIHVVARDGWSGFPRLFEREYRLGSQVQDGTFEAGRSFKIVPWSG
jgi:hypothetical protein